MGRFVDHTGKTFGRLTVKNVVGKNSHGKYSFSCVCSCGNVATVLGNSLVSGRTNSCGCLAREVTSNINRSHERSHDPTYRSWAMMKNRVTNPNFELFHRYGGRGISMDSRWEDFEAFLEDMGPRPSLATSLDRKDNDGDYTKDNCRWATAIEQANNKANNLRVEYEGELLTARQISERTGVDHNKIRARIGRGRPPV